MAELPAQKPDAPSEPASPETLRKLRMGAFVVVGVLVAGGAWWVLGEINKSRALDRWAQLDAIEVKFRDAFSTRSWLNPLQKSDVDARDEHARKLEEFLAKTDGDAALTAHVRARIADVRLSQAFGRLAAGGSGAEIDGYLAAAEAQLETLRDKHPDMPLNWPAFGRGMRDAGGAPVPDAPSVVRRALAEIAKLRAWEKEHALRPVEPDADLVVVLRTTAGDLHVRTLSSVSPVSVRTFVDRACAGKLDGVRIFERRDRPGLGWVRVGSDATKKDPASDDDRLAWDDASSGETRTGEPGRYRVLHTAGTLTSWHVLGESQDDPQQFLLVVKDSNDLDFEHTPFARLEPGLSLATLERIAALPTFSRDRPGERLVKPGLADQLVAPVRIVKALVYDKGTARACATPLADDEKSLSTLRPDAYRSDEPPAPPPSPTGDGAAMNAPPPAMSDTPDDR